jgi:hypothetical protein
MAECPSKALNYNANCDTEKELVYPIATSLLVECTPTPSVSSKDYISRPYQKERILDPLLNGDYVFTELITPTPTPSVTPSFTPTHTPTPTPTPTPPLVPSPTPTVTPTLTPNPTPSITPEPPITFNLQLDIKVMTRAKFAFNMLTSEFALFHETEGPFPVEPKAFTYIVRSGINSVINLFLEWNTAWQQPRIKGTPPASTRSVQFKNGVLTYEGNNTWKFDGLNKNYRRPNFNDYRYLIAIRNFARTARPFAAAVVAAAPVLPPLIFGASSIAGAAAVATGLNAAGAYVAGYLASIPGATVIGSILSSAAGVITQIATFLGPIGWVIGAVFLILSFFINKPPPPRKIPQWSSVTELPMPVAATHRNVNLQAGTIPAWSPKGGIRIEQYPTAQNGYMVIVDLDTIEATPTTPSATDQGFQFTLEFVQ